MESELRSANILLVCLFVFVFSYQYNSQFAQSIYLFVEISYD